MLRQVLAPVAGVVVGAAVVALVEAAGRSFYPTPTVVPAEQGQLVVGALPLGALAAVVVAWGLGAMAGSFVAALIARRHARRAALIAGGVLLASTVANLVMIPHPIWMMLAGPLVVAAGTLAAVRLAGAGAND